MKPSLFLELSEVHNVFPKAFLPHIFSSCVPQILQKVHQQAQSNLHRRRDTHTFSLTYGWLKACAVALSYNVAYITGRCTSMRPFLFLWRQYVSILQSNIHGSMHRNNKSQQVAHVTEFILSDNCSTCFGLQEQKQL